MPPVPCMTRTAFRTTPRVAFRGAEGAVVDPQLRQCLTGGEAKIAHREVGFVRRRGRRLGGLQQQRDQRQNVHHREAGAFRRLEV